MSNITRLAVIALGLAVGALALALFYDGGGSDPSDMVILLGAVALALIIAGAVVTPQQARPQVRRRRRR
jgi:hypothetical protein